MRLTARYISNSLYQFPVPRMLFEGFSVSDFHTIFQSKEALYELVDFIVGFIKVSVKLFTSVQST